MRPANGVSRSLQDGRNRRVAEDLDGVGELVGPGEPGLVLCGMS